MGSSGSTPVPPEGADAGGGSKPADDVARGAGTKVLHTLRVATLNAYMFPFGLTPANSERAVKIVSSAALEHDADVLALQEVWCKDTRAQLEKAGKGFGYRFSVGSPTGGLLLLSRFPVANFGWHRFDNAGRPEMVAHGDFWGRKGVMVCMLRTPGGPVAVANTHLVARYTPAGDALHDVYVGHRAGQLTEVLVRCGLTPPPDAMRGAPMGPGLPPPLHLWPWTQHARDGTPVVLVGDVNLQPNDPELASFIRMGGLTDVAARPGGDVGGALPSCAVVSLLPDAASDGVVASAVGSNAVASHPYGTASRFTSPFARTDAVAKKLDHVFVGALRPGLGCTSPSSVGRLALQAPADAPAELAFTGSWTQEGAEPWRHRLVGWLMGRGGAGSRLTYSDHVGIVSTLQVVQSPPGAAPPPPSSTPASSAMLLASYMDDEVHNAAARAQYNLQVAAAAALAYYGTGRVQLTARVRSAVRVPLVGAGLVSLSLAAAAVHQRQMLLKWRPYAE